MKRPENVLGMRHVALNVRQLEACEEFYVKFLGMEVEWRPDEDNIYLSSGSDNLALHRISDNGPFAVPQRLDHIGFIVGSAEEVDRWYEFMLENDVTARAPPRTHRDAARSFYCTDPEGTLVQIIYHPPIAGQSMPKGPQI
jgi:catechol 2,3-dioxygenase-like lactoylglutathione lyase family enzyme